MRNFNTLEQCVVDDRDGCLGLRSPGGLLAFSALSLLIATPAAANPLGDCFERIAVAFHSHHQPHKAVAHTAIHRVHHVGPRRHPRPHKIAASGPSRAYAHRTRYILRPIACASHPTVALMTPVPGTVAPETPRELVAELAGPAVAVAAPVEGVDTGDLAPAPVAPAPALSELDTPLFGFPGIFGGPGGPSGVLLPGGPGPPGGVFPGAPPVIPGPGPGGVPEPATWAFLLVGFLGLGGALRRRRQALTSRARLAGPAVRPHGR